MQAWSSSRTYSPDWEAWLQWLADLPEVPVSGKHNDLENVGRTRATTPSSRCSETSALATTSSVKRSDWPGRSSRRSSIDKDKLWVTVFEDDDEAAAPGTRWLASRSPYPETRRERQLLVHGDTSLRPALRSSMTMDPSTDRAAALRPSRTATSRSGTGVHAV